ncbi:hypothetical protein WJX77_011163 [Trebouxia sp. C0004]
MMRWSRAFDPGLKTTVCRLRHSALNKQNLTIAHFGSRVVCTAEAAPLLEEGEHADETSVLQCIWEDQTETVKELTQ